ncbi:MAG: hypothetical protein FWG66_03220 [Spirochaetes bacterium]|nr:hypothetical protein [Spirochaetota bacterium]
MTDMTDEEYDALDRRWTETTPKVNFSKPGIFARGRGLLQVSDVDPPSYIVGGAGFDGQGAQQKK